MRATILVVLLSILLVFLIESLLIISYKVSNQHHYFENKIEADSNNLLAHHAPYQSQTTIKLATFGGSSAAGYTSIFSVAFLVDNALSRHSEQIKSSNSLSVVNFARNGHPFLAGQSDVLELMLDYFDVFFVYAGHNEIVAHFNMSDRKSPGAIISIPWERSTNWLQAFAREQATIISGDQRLSVEFLDRWRTFYLSKKIAAKLVHKYRAITAKTNNHSRISSKHTNETSIPPVHQLIDSEQSLTEQEIQSIPRLYKKRLDEILDKMDSDKLIVLSTVLSNDLWPPLFEQGTGSQASEELINDGYDAYYEKDIETLHNTLNHETFPKGAHYYWLKGMLLLWTEGYKSNEAWNYLKFARNKDASKLRVLTTTNNVIRSFANSSNTIRVIDPAKTLLAITNSVEEYQSYFLDFQHPSPKGQLFIARMLVEALGYNSQNLLPTTVGSCGIPLDYTFYRGSTKILPETIYKICIKELGGRIKWLEHFKEHVNEDRPYVRQKEKATSLLERISNR